MARKTNQRDLAPVLDAAKHWIDRCLIGDQEMVWRGKAGDLVEHLDNIGNDLARFFAVGSSLGNLDLKHTGVIDRAAAEALSSPTINTRVSEVVPAANSAASLSSGNLFKGR